MRGSDFGMVAIEINDATSVETLDRIEQRLTAAALAGEGDERTRLLRRQIAERREAIRTH